MNAFIRAWIPDGARRILNKAVWATLRYKGPYLSWTDARNATKGYDDSKILHRVAEATQVVLSRTGFFEQDGTVVPGDAPPSHALSALLLAASQQSGEISAVDFGGGLGTHFLRWRPWLTHLKSVQWEVVEQANYVAKGREIFSSVPQISFTETINDTTVKPNFVLASGVLQFMPEPMVTIGDLMALGAKVIVLDRTPFSDDGVERILTQHVPWTLGKASYPLRSLSKKAAYDRIGAAYDLVLEFSSMDEAIQERGIEAHFTGSVWVLRSPR